MALSQEELAAKMESMGAPPFAAEMIETELGPKKVNTPINLISPETREEGTIKLRDYRDIFSYSVLGVFGFFILFIVCSITSVLQLLPSLWLTRWVEGNLEEQQK